MQTVIRSDIWGARQSRLMDRCHHRDHRDRPCHLALHVMAQAVRVLLLMQLLPLLLPLQLVQKETSMAVGWHMLRLFQKQQKSHQ